MLKTIRKETIIVFHILFLLSLCTKCAIFHLVVGAYNLKENSEIDEY